MLTFTIDFDKQEVVMDNDKKVDDKKVDDQKKKDNKNCLALIYLEEKIENLLSKKEKNSNAIEKLYQTQSQIDDEIDEIQYVIFSLFEE